MNHKCHAVDCDAETPRWKLMCGKHWAMVPQSLRKQVLDHYERGQCDGRVRPSVLYLRAARAAISYVRDKENQTRLSKKEDSQ